MSWLIAGGIKHIPWDSPGRGLWDTCAWFPRDSTPCAFSLCWLYFVSFHWHKSWPWTYVCYVLSPSESPNPSWGLSWGSWHAFQTCYASWVFLSQLVSPFNPVSRVRNLRSILDCSLGASTKSCQFALEVSWIQAFCNPGHVPSLGARQLSSDLPQQHPCLFFCLRSPFQPICVSSYSKT